MTTNLTRPGMIDRTCSALFQLPWMQSFNTQARRRWLVVGFIVSLGGLIFAAQLNNVIALIVAIVPYVTAVVLLSGATQGLFDKRRRGLDERQAQMRQSVFKEPYVVGVTIGLLGGMMLAWILDQPDVTSFGLSFALITAALSVPVAIATWRLEDPVDDGE